MNCRRIFLAAGLLFFCASAFAFAQGEGAPGTIKWSTERVRASLSSPALSSDGTIIYAGGSDGQLYAYDAETGDPVGTNELNHVLHLGGGTAYAPLVDADETVYVALSGGLLVAVTNGLTDDFQLAYGVKWRVRSPRAMVGSPVMDEDGVVYVGSLDHRLRAVRPDGSVSWTFQSGQDITSSPVLDPDGNINFGAGRSLFIVAPAGGQLSVTRGPAILGTPVVSEDGTIYFGSSDRYLYGVNGSGTNALRWRRGAGGAVRTSPAIGVTGNIFFGSDSRRVHCLNTNGVIPPGTSWPFQTKGVVRGDVAIGADGTIYVGADDRRLYAVTADGRQKWAPIETGGAVRSSPVIDGNGTIYFTSKDHRLYAVHDNAATGDFENAWPGFRRDAAHSARATTGNPYILHQPADVTITNGSKVEFSVFATAGAPLEYQWFLDGAEIDTSINPSAATATLRISSVDLRDEGIYTVEVSNEFGSLASEAAELTVLSRPQITSDLTNRFVNVGTTLRLEVGVLGLAPRTNVWRFNGALLTGQTNTSLVISNIQADHAGTYQLTASDSRGSVTSRLCAVTVVTNVLNRPAGDSIAAGHRFSAAVLTNALFTWGTDNSGQLGDGGTSTRNVAARVSTNESWLLVSAGGRGTNPSGAVVNGHALALRTDGSLWAWGVNTSGQLGTNNFADHRAPLRVGTGTNWVHAEAGAAHSVALRDDGTIWTWGANQFGQLGHGTSHSISSPSQMGPDSGWVEVRAGGHFTLARRVDGTIWGWGRNESAQLGDTVTNSSPVPVRIGTNSDWASISAGVSHSAGIRANGTLWNWGRHFGLATIRLETTTNLFKAPTQVGDTNNWTAVDAGYDHTLALNSDGQMFAWGANDIGQLGNETSGSAGNKTNDANQTLPVQIGATRSWAAVAAGWKHSVARASDGTLWAWGWNAHGQVGDQAGFTNHKAPVLVAFTNSAPVLTVQPSNAVVTVTSNATFTAAAIGAAPLAFQWRFNATNIAGATNLSLTLTNAQAANAGTYDVVVGNSSGTASSDRVTLTVLPYTNNPPGITQQPTNMTVTVSNTATFTVGVTGAPPLVLRWRFGTTILADETNASLVITNVQAAQDGVYSAIVTNHFGSVTSVFATLTVTANVAFAAAPKFGEVDTSPLVLRSTPGSNGVVISVRTLNTRPFVIEYRDSLSETNWRPLGTHRGSGVTTLRDTNAPGATRFYRARVP